MRTASIVAFCLLAVGAADARAQIHCSELPPLTGDAEFPRCGRSELIVAGFPDHMHAYTWPDWQPPVGADGQTYGPGSLCQGQVLTDERGRLTAAPGGKSLGRFILRHHEGYRDCDMVPFLELMEWAEVHVEDVLGLAVTDTLDMVNPDNVQRYGEITGYGTWRLFARDGDRAVLQPVPTLRARTLEGHAAVMLMTDWALEETFGDALPRWLHRGLVEYVAEDGPHLANYMAEFRDAGPILLSPPMVDAIMARGVDADPGRDREYHRKAGYSAFLMVWELVENQGGLVALRDFLGQIAGGIDLDRAALSVYGLDMAGLAGLLDAAQLGEPYGHPMDRHRPHIQP